MTSNAVKTLLQDSVSNAKKDGDGKKEQKTEIKVGRGRRAKKKEENWVYSAFLNQVTIEFS